MSPQILFLEDDPDLLEMLVQTVRCVFHRSCIGIDCVPELARHRDEVLGCSLCILDINLGVGQPDGFAAYRWLRQNGFHGRIVFLTGHAGQHPQARRIVDERDVLIYEKPLEVAELRAIVEEAVP